MEGSRTFTYLSHACSATTTAAKMRNGKTQTRRSDGSATRLTNMSSAYSHSRTWVWLTGTAVALAVYRAAVFQIRNSVQEYIDYGIVIIQIL